MACWAIIPVKRFGSAKSRLADLCDVDERARLAEAMLADTLTTVCAARGLSGIALVTADDKAATLGRQAGAFVLPDNTADLNSALTQTREQVRSKAGKVALLTLPIDLPALAVEDVEAIIETGRDATSVVVVPDHDREGTNALLLGPEVGIPFAFGPGSFEQHIKLAKAADLEPQTLTRPRMAWDFDNPSDLHQITAFTVGSRTSPLMTALTRRANELVEKAS